MGGRGEIPVGDKDIGLGVLEHGGKLGCGETPVQWNRHRADLGRTEQHLDHLDGAFVHDRDAAARPGALGQQSLRDLVAARVELGVGHGPLAGGQCRSVTTGAGVPARLIGQAVVGSVHDLCPCALAASLVCMTGQPPPRGNVPNCAISYSPG